MFDVAHYSEFLRARLQERLAQNPKYSLRAFARDLDLQPSKLSEVLNRKQGLSEAAARRIGRKLGLSPAETERFCQLVAASDSRSRKARLAAQARLAAEAGPAQEFRELQEDSFRIISDWYHFALLELLETSGFRNEPAWIARRLGISRLEAEEAVARLERLGLVERVRGGGIRSTGVQLTTPTGVPSESIRKFNRQIIEKALEAITFQGVEERELGSLTVAIRESDLPELRTLLQEQRRALNRFVMERNRRRKPDEVYCLSTQFFRMTVKNAPAPPESVPQKVKEKKK